MKKQNKKAKKVTKKVYAPRHTISVAMHKDIHNRLKAVAKKQNRSVSSIVSELTKAFLVTVKG